VSGQTNCAVRNGPYTFYGNYTPASLHQETRGIFAEFNLPVFDTLNVDLAIRHEELGQAGSTTNPKAQARWQATDWIAFRGSVGTTFRAPPAAILVPAAVTALAFTPQTSNYRPYDTFGNPNLKPEKATNYNIGAIVTADALTATVDYWHFDFQNPLTTESGLNIINAIFPIGLPNHCGDAAFTQLLTRVTFTGGGCAAANIVRTKVFNINGAPVHTSGIDFAADYILDDFGWGGSLDTHIDGTYTIDYKVGAQVVEGVTTQAAFNAAGKLNYLLSVNSLPNWKGTLSFNYTNGPHSLQIAEHYIGGMTDQRASIFSSTNSGQGVVTRGMRIAPFITTDLFYRYNWADQGLSFNLALVNLFDRDPPFARLDYSYDPFTSNPLGRTIKFGVTADL
jgi:iron complex outermembrane receptor protein